MDKQYLQEIGTKVEITINDIFGKPYIMQGKINSHIYHHGYHCKGGGWSVFGNDEDIPCYKVEFVEKGKRRGIVLKIRDVISSETIIPTLVKKRNENDKLKTWINGL